MNDIRSEAQALYREEGLAFPPIPQGSPLVRLDDHAFATAAVSCDLYNFDCFVRGWRDAAAPAYRAFGFAGHGLNSFAVHYYVLGPRVALAMQHRWSSILDDADEARARYDALLGLMGSIERYADELHAAGRFPAGERFAVAHSSFHGSRWGWLAPGRAPEWHETPGTAPADAIAELARMRRGASQPA